MRLELSYVVPAGAEGVAAEVAKRAGFSEQSHNLDYRMTKHYQSTHTQSRRVRKARQQKWRSELALVSHIPLKLE